MAQKRALVAAVLIAPNASDYFTQDIDDCIEGEYREVAPPPAGSPPPEPWFPPGMDATQPKTIDYSGLPEAVRTMKNSDGKLYTDLDTPKLSNMANAMTTKLKENGLPDGEKQRLTDKLEAARAILAARS